MAAPSAEAIIKELAALPQDQLAGDTEARIKAVGLARQLSGVLAHPIENALEILFSPYFTSAIQTAQRLGIFEELAKAAPGTSVSTPTLAKTLNAEEHLLGRVLRLLASTGFVLETDLDQWTATPTSHAMANPVIAAGQRFIWDIQAEGLVQAPAFLKETGWRSPVEPTNGFIQYANRTKYSIFDFMAEKRPDRLDDFHVFMGMTMWTRDSWLQWYPIQENLLSSYDPSVSDVVLVDIGAGKGHDLIAFADKFPDVKGKLVLEDLPAALATIKDRDARLVYQPQDFFEPNAVPNSRIYFMHHILHDWSDKYALKILENVKKAMKPGYSKLLVHDLILPDTGVSRHQAGLDMAMMAFNSGIERSRKQWKTLMDAAGLEIVGFYHGKQGEDVDGIVEVIIPA